MQVASASTASTLQAPISLLEKTPTVLEVLLRDVASDVLQWKPAPDRWSISEVLRHLLDIEQLYERRARIMVMEEAPALPKFVAPSESDLRPRPAGDSLEQFVTLRRAFAVFLHSLSAAAGKRIGQHAELGVVTLSQMLHELANHDLGHLRQIGELYRARVFYPNAGPFQKYSNPKP